MSKVEWRWTWDYDVGFFAQTTIIESVHRELANRKSIKIIKHLKIWGQATFNIYTQASPVVDVGTGGVLLNIEQKHFGQIDLQSQGYINPDDHDSDGMERNDMLSL